MSLTEATPKFAFNMRILAVKDGEHPLSHNIKEEPLPMVAEVVSRTAEDIDALSDAAETVPWGPCYAVIRRSP